MKKLFALLFLLLPLFVFGQSKESNNLFKKGMQLFKSKNYNDMIKKVEAIYPFLL